MTPDQIPFYLDWKFWSFFVSATALVVSLTPTIWKYIRPARLDVEIYSQVCLTHGVGNPNFQMHLIVTNIGGRTARVKGIRIGFARSKEDQFELPAQNYLQNPADKLNVLLTSFRLKSGEEWAHIVNFFNLFSREEERECRDLKSKLRSNIYEKRNHLSDEEKKKDVAADEDVVASVVKFFDRKFRWLPGEYELTLYIDVEPQRASVRKKYRITLFESDSKELADIKDEFKYGYGVLRIGKEMPQILVPVFEGN